MKARPKCAQCIRIMRLKKSVLARATAFLNAAAEPKDQWATKTTKSECHFNKGDENISILGYLK